MDSTGAYVDSVLDTIPGLVHKEYVRYWRCADDIVRFRINMGIYLDEQFPNDVVKSTILTMVDSAMARTFEEDADSVQAETLTHRIISKQSPRDFMDSWEQVFDQLTRINGYGPQDDRLFEIPDTRGCTICHKVYEDAEWATYGLQFSFHYHFCTVSRCDANYFSVNKQTGEVLSISDVLAQYGQSKIGPMLVETYKREAALRDFNPGQYTGDDLIARANGVAIISEGILFYFFPYNIGCGVEGQYNLILNP